MIPPIFHHSLIYPYNIQFFGGFGKWERLNLFSVVPNFCYSQLQIPLQVYPYINQIPIINGTHSPTLHIHHVSHQHKYTTSPFNNQLARGPKNPNLQSPLRKYHLLQLPHRRLQLWVFPLRH